MDAFSPSLVAFYVLSALVVALALVAVSASNLIRAAIALAFSFFAVSGLFWLLGSPFLAVVQLVVNAGAISIVTVFIVMMTHSRRTYLRGWSAVAAALVVTLPLAALLVAFGRDPSATEGPFVLGVERFGVELLSVRGRESILSSGERLVAETGAIVAFEVAALVLLGALVGAVVLARQAGSGETEERDADA